MLNQKLLNALTALNTLASRVYRASGGHAGKNADTALRFEMRRCSFDTLPLQQLIDGGKTIRVYQGSKIITMGPNGSTVRNSCKVRPYTMVEVPGI